MSVGACNDQERLPSLRVLIFTHSRSWLCILQMFCLVVWTATFVYLLFHFEHSYDWAYQTVGTTVLMSDLIRNTGLCWYLITEV